MKSAENKGRTAFAAAIVVALGIAVSAVATQGCANTLAINGDGNDGGGVAACLTCVMDSDCNGSVCAQFQGDTFCAPSCPNGQSDCAAGSTCTQVSSAAGDPVSVCEPDNGACGASMGNDGGAPPNTCPGLADPMTAAGCTSCTPPGGSKSCQVNGCYGGWWCNTVNNKCQAPPQSCGSPDAGPLDAGGPVTGTIGNNGGTESKLYFAIVGDTRPAVIDDTAGYPSTTISKIYSDINAMSPKPPFVVTTGDYQFSSAWGSEATKQFALYTAARGKYTGVEFPAMGNHECTGATSSNCGPSGVNGITNNYTAFMNALLAPLGKTEPYYVINVNATDSSWTAKFVFIAANAWDSTQSSWLDSTLSTATTYTFIVRHESSTTAGVTGVTASQSIIAAHPYTLLIVGHTHSYWHGNGTKEVLFGNGGAPLTSKNFGYGVVTQRSDLSIQVDAIDMNTNLPDSYFRFALKPDGTPTP